MSTETDAKADGQFQPTPVHRAGYQTDRLEFLMQWLAMHPDATLQSGEGGVLLDEINRVREVAEANYRNMERLGVEVKRLRARIDAVLALPTWDHDPTGDTLMYATMGKMDEAGYTLTEEYAGDWARTADILAALEGA
jgi:hypothetical protein